MSFTFIHIGIIDNRGDPLCARSDLSHPRLVLEGARHAETARVVELGATLLTSQPVLEDDCRWHVLTDPDGNEFCVPQPPERP
ncbi:MAG: VOC family protein [Streptosporangiaceae bacterium]